MVLLFRNFKYFKYLKYFFYSILVFIILFSIIIFISKNLLYNYSDLNIDDTSLKESYNSEEYKKNIENFHIDFPFKFDFYKSEYFFSKNNSLGIDDFYYKNNYLKLILLYKYSLCENNNYQEKKECHYLLFKKYLYFVKYYYVNNEDINDEKNKYKINGYEKINYENYTDDEIKSFYEEYIKESRKYLNEILDNFDYKYYINNIINNGFILQNYTVNDIEYNLDNIKSYLYFSYIRIYDKIASGNYKEGVSLFLLNQNFLDFLYNNSFVSKDLTNKIYYLNESNFSAFLTLIKNVGINKEYLDLIIEYFENNKLEKKDGFNNTMKIYYLKNNFNIDIGDRILKSAYNDDYFFIKLYYYLQKKFFYSETETLILYQKILFDIVNLKSLNTKLDYIEGGFLKKIAGIGNYLGRKYIVKEALNDYNSYIKTDNYINSSREDFIKDLKLIN